MHWIVGLLPGRQMASGSAAGVGRNVQSVVVVDMARSAGHIRVAKSKREACGAVIEIGRVPSLGRMAVRAICQGKRGTGGCVHRIVRLLPRSEVASRISAVIRRNLQIVIVVDMARRARNICVAVGQ